MSFLSRFKTETAFKNITATDYRTEFFNKKPHVLVDVRTPGEYRQGHLPGAVNIPLNDLQRRIQEVPTDKTVIVVCATGNRSRTGATLIMRAGNEDVYNLQGGTMAWMMQGQPLEV